MLVGPVSPLQEGFASFKPGGIVITPTPPKGYTHGCRIDENPDDSVGRHKPREGLRRLDRIHITRSLLPSVSSLYTTFLAKSDHKALVVALAPPQFVHETPRWHCPITFRENEQAVECLAQQLSKLECPSPSDWFQAAHHIIGRYAVDYHKTHHPPTTQDANILGILLASTKDKLCRQGHSFLAARGHYPATEQGAYSMLVTLYDKEV